MKTVKKLVAKLVEDFASKMISGIGDYERQILTEILLEAIQTERNSAREYIEAEELRQQFSKEQNELYRELYKRGE